MRAWVGLLRGYRALTRELSADYIVPSVFNRDVAPAVAAAVSAAAGG